MFDLSQITELMDAIVFPLLGGFILVMSKFRVGEVARSYERQFMAVLVVFTIITLRTVILCDEIWLVHTTALGALILAAMVIPGQEQSVPV